MKRLAILDRDATLIDVVRDEDTGTLSVAFHPSHLVLLPGVLHGLAALRDAGYLLAIATNQPGPAKGQMSSRAVHATNAALLELLSGHGIVMAHVAVCLHHPDGGPGGDASLVGPCGCRKPKPGMLTATLAALEVDPGRAWMIGDSRDDVAAAHAAGVRAALVFPTNRCQLCPLRDGPDSAPEVVAPRFDEVVREVLAADSR